MSENLAFLSPEWVVKARETLEALVAVHGESGKSFSACEVFTDAPPGLAGDAPTTAAWHFVIEGKQVTVGEGEIEGADMAIRVDYVTSLPAARTVYTPEMIAGAQAGDDGGKGPAFPAYLVELHNTMAVITE